jgi:hypothetical protein
MSRGGHWHTLRQTGGVAGEEARRGCGDEDPSKRVDKWGNTNLAREPLVARDRGRSRLRRGARQPAGLSGDSRLRSRFRQKIAGERD